MTEAIRSADAARVFVLNLMTEPGETTAFDAPRHLEVIEEHLGFQPFDHVIFNTAPVPAAPRRGVRKARLVTHFRDHARYRGHSRDGNQAARCTARVRGTDWPRAPPPRTTGRSDHRLRQIWPAAVAEEKDRPMYERFYNLRERPFALSPDPEYLYLSRVHREALDSIRYGIESRAGFIVITGDIGAGKTTLLQTILQRLDDRTVVARLVNTTLEPRELLEAILIEFGLDTTGKSKPALLRDLGQFLVRQRTEGRRPLLVVDEAQNLSAAGLEEIRLLSNLETEKSKLLQILLAGQPNLRDTIASPELEQFRQRVAVSYHLIPLDVQETAAYIHSRLDHAAIGAPPRFPADAAELVHRRSGGVPRTINVICDAALVFGYAEERRQIDLHADPGRRRRTRAHRCSQSGVRELSRACERWWRTCRLRRRLASAPVAVRRAEAPAVLSSELQNDALARVAQETAARAAALNSREQTLLQRERRARRTAPCTGRGIPAASQSTDPGSGDGRRRRKRARTPASRTGCAHAIPAVPARGPARLASDACSPTHRTGRWRGPGNCSGARSHSMSALVASLLEKIRDAPRQGRRGRPWLCRPATRRRARQGGLPDDRHRSGRAQDPGNHAMGSRTSPMCRRPMSRD